MSRVESAFPRVVDSAPAEVEQLLTVEEAAELLSVAPSWVYQHATPKAANPLPYVKVGRYTRFEESRLKAWIDRQRGGKR